MERKISLLCLLVLLPVSFSFADVYRSVDENGNTVFSDQPSKRAKQVELPPVQTYSSPEVEKREPVKPASEESNVGYTSLLLSGVENNTTLTYNQPINVMVTSIPPLHESDHYVLLVDGQSVGGPQTNGQFVIPPGLTRGSHTIKAVIINGDHNIIQESNTIQFTIFQRSTLLGPKKRVTK